MTSAITPLGIAGAYIIEPALHGDERGAFSEVYRADMLAEAGFNLPFVQENQSWSPFRGTVRGLHFQAPPYAQDKLVRVVAGAILDVIVDIRRDSPTWGKSIAFELSARNRRQLLAPTGVAHGFCTLAEQTEVIYKVTNYYAPLSEGGLLWSDPALEIDWPLHGVTATVNNRDNAWPRLVDLDSPFP